MSGPLVTLSMGMGVDSAALLTRWLLEPDTRMVPGPGGVLVPFKLADLTVVTAMPGNEYAATEQAMTTHMLPLMREHGVRYVQVARAGWSETDGVLVLDDSTGTTTGMVMRGPVALEDEMNAVGTIPQVSSRLCSYRFKGWVLDRWAEGEYAGADRVHVVGYAAEEVRRRDRDTVYAAATPGKTPFYPLIEWRWDRGQCLDYLRGVYGIEWPRSCCGFCPFQAGPDLARMARRWRSEPAQVRTAVRMEATALALNPRMRLFGDRAAADLARGFGLGEVVDAALAELGTEHGAIYDVRRVYRRAGDRRHPSGSGWLLGPDPAVKATKGSAVWRSLTEITTGSREDLVVQLTRWLPEWARELGRPLELEPIPGGARLWLQRAGDMYPCVEHYLTIARAGIPDKEQPAFGELWEHTFSLDLDRQGDLWAELAVGMADADFSGPARVAEACRCGADLTGRDAACTSCSGGAPATDYAAAVEAAQELFAILTVEDAEGFEGWEQLAIAAQGMS